MKQFLSTRRGEESIGGAEVARYLQRHPEFFGDHQHLLETLTIPHESGTAVSLVARQLDVLRERNRRLAQQLDELVQIARENDALYQRTHQLTLALLDARTVEDVLASLDWGLHQYFQADFGVVRILAPWRDSPVANLFVPRGATVASWCETVIDAEQPWCGRPEPEPAAFLFGRQAAEVASMAVMGLRHAGLRGLFAIGSRDAARFRPDMSFVLLGQMSEILAARLAMLVHEPG